MRRSAGIVFTWLVLLLIALPGLARSAAEETAAAPAVDETAVGETVEQTPPEVPFRLYARRDVGLRLRPDVGIRVPPAVPLFSPRSADYLDRDLGRADTPRYAIAAALTALAADGERDSFKGQEFRDLGEDVAVGVDAVAWSARDRFRLTGRHLTLDDRDLALSWRRIGVFEAELRHNRIPHRFAFDARTLYGGIGTGHLTVDDAVRRTLEGSTSLLDAAERARRLVAAAPAGDLALARDRYLLKLDLTAFDPFAFEVSVHEESRQGVRPWSGSFGFANVVEIPWGVDYRTRDVEVGFEYAGAATLVRGSWRHSTFDDEIDAQLFDNPWRTTDLVRGASIIDSFASGPATGRIDLYPSNERQELVLTAQQRDLPGESTVTATVSWARAEQDDPLLPYSTNTALVPGAPTNPPFDASDPANLPAARADAALESRLVHLRWTARPHQSFEIRAHLRDYQLDNETAQIFIPGFALEDQGWRPYLGTGGGFTNLPIAHATTEYGADLVYRAGATTRLTLGYEREEIERDFREVERSSEDRLKLSIDAKPVPWADLRASYEYSEKDAQSYVFDQFFTNQGLDFIPALPFLLKFDQASRDRDRFQLIASVYPGEAWIVGAQIVVGGDDFPESRFGVLGDDHAIYSLDASFAASERLSVFASVSVERYDVLLQGRQWVPFGAGDPFRVEPGLESASNWTARSVDDIETVTVGVEAVLVPDRLRFDLSFAWSRSDGRIDYASPLGALDANPFVPVAFDRVDDVTFYNLDPELEYTVSDRLSLTLAYVREKYEIFDLAGTGFQLVPTTAGGDFNGAIFMGTLPRDFDIEVLALALKAVF